MIDFKRQPGAWGFLPFWSLLVLTFDFFIGKGIVEGLRSEWFEAAPGVITKSDIRRGGRGSPHFEVEYTYTVNGRPFTGTKYHVARPQADDAYWLALRDDHPVGTPVTIYFDPDDPTTAYLEPGLRPDAMFGVWWLTPFNLSMVGMAWAGFWELSGCRMFDPALRRCVWPVPDGWLARTSPNLGFLPGTFLVLFLITFFGCFLLMGHLMVFGFPPQWWLVITMWVVALVASTTLGEYGSRQALIQVNELEGTLSFAGTTWGRTTVTREQLRGVDVTGETRKNKGTEYKVFVVTLRWQGDFENEETACLAVYDDRRDADALAEWLREHLGLVVRPPETHV